MRTLMVVLGGLVLLVLFALIGHSLGGDAVALAHGAVCFIPVWLLLSGINLWIGVKSAGYSIAEEAPIFAIIFAVPAAAAIWLWWKFSHA